MAGRGKVPIYMVIFSMTFGLLGLISFQALKERKHSSILLVAKYKEIDELNNQYEELWEASKKNLSQAKKEKDNLLHKILDLENSKKLHHDICKEDKEKYKIKKDQEITILKEKLQAKDIELTKLRAKIKNMKLNNKKVNEEMVIKSIVKDDVLADDNKNSNPKNPTLQNGANDKNITDVGRIVEESNIAREAKVEDTKKKVSFEVDEVEKASPNESDIKLNNTLEEEDDAKELEVDIEVSDFNTRESDKSQIQE